MCCARHNESNYRWKYDLNHFEHTNNRMKSYVLYPQTPYKKYMKRFKHSHADIVARQLFHSNSRKSFFINVFILRSLYFLSTIFIRFYFILFYFLFFLILSIYFLTPSTYRCFIMKMTNEQKKPGKGSVLLENWIRVFPLFVFLFVGS